MMKRLYILLAGLAVTTTKLYAAIEPVNHRVQGQDLFDLTVSGTHELADNKYWMIDGGVADFELQSVKDRIIFGIDESDMTYRGEFSYRITFDVDYEEFVNGALVNKNFDDIVLQVSYDPVRGSKYQDRGIFAFTGGLNVVISDVAIEYESAIGANDWDEVTDLGEASDELNGGIFLEIEIETERYYDFNPSTTPTSAFTVSIVGDEAIVSWPFMAGAEEYDLEWAWVSRYSADAAGNLSLLGAGAVRYNFDENATRVRISGQNTYNIPLIYGNGYIVLRYRGVGRGGANFTVPIEGTWSNGSSGIVSSASTYFSVAPHEGDGINYGAGMSFIENGVNSVGVTYMDGVLKPRQSQAKLNGQDKIIVGSTIYDYHGRPAIGVMSSPVDQSTLGYVEDLNMYDDGVNPAIPYEKQLFDVDQTPVCGEFEPAPPMDPVASEGSANYYSPENSDQEGYNAYLPDAQGYPFVQVQYSPDPTGRIKKVGGVGADHQLGNTADGDAHFTEYFYTTPDDNELWALFGNDAARVQNYTKVITKDVHGQISVALIDGMGRTVATYLEGPAPAGLEEIEGNVGLSPTGKDLMAYNQQFENGVIQVQTPIVVVQPEVPYTFNYNFTGVTFDACLPENICYDCVYELEITIMPAQFTACEMTDGAEEDPETVSIDGIYHKTFVVGNIESFDTDCDEPLVFSETFPGDEQFTIQFGEAGEYYVIKTLKVSEAPVAYYWEQYQQQNTCLLTYEDFFENSLAQVDWTQCESYDPCEFNFLLEYGTEEEWIENHEGMDEEDYADLKNEYLADCSTQSPCDIILPLLLLDMSPGGQYGSENLSDPLSVFNTGNSLSGDWDDVTYHNADGSISYVDSDGDLVEDDLPTTLSAAEFIAIWQPSWAMDLIPFHPEYCYYEFCQVYPEIADFQQDLFAIETYADACASGYINPAEDAGYFDLAACVTDVPDPIFGAPYAALSGGDQSDVDDIMNALYDSNSIYEMAVIMSGDNPGVVAFGSGCNGDAHWENFRILYMSKRFQVFEIVQAKYVADNCPDAACVGNDDPGCDASPFDESLKRHFTFGSVMGYDLTELGTDDWEDEADNASLSVTGQCDTMCTNQAAIWMQQLVGCGDQLTPPETWAPGQTTYDYIYDELIEICAGGCAGGCFNLTQLDESIVSNPGSDIYASFEELIEYNFDVTETCTHLLITNPQPGPCEDLGPYFLNPCNCNMLLDVDTEEEFAALYGYTPANFEGDRCKCDTYDTSPDNDTIDAGEMAALITAEIETNTKYVCPEICIRCLQITGEPYGQLYLFEQEYGVEYFENPSLFTAFANGLLGTDFTYEELSGFIENCQALATGEEEPMYNLIGEKAYAVRNLLTALIEDDITTSDTYNHTSLPDYFYGGLYSCTDQSTATLSYSPSLASDVLDFDLMGPGCTGTCNVELDIVGSIPVEFANATEYYQNIISFDEVFVTDADLSPLVLNIFHINVTLDDQAGGTLDGEIIVTTCYDIFEILETGTPPEEVSDMLLCPQVITPEGDPCMQNLIEQAALDAEAQYEAYMEEQYDFFAEAYISACSLVEDETFTMEYEAGRYHYTLLYYDQSGNLTKTVSPKGVNRLDAGEIADAIDFANGIGSAVYPLHTFVTNYKHNSLNQVTEVTTPDGGTSNYWYDHIGRLVVSQNARQDEGHEEYGVDLYSYTRYDQFGRVYEVGECMNNELMTDAIAKDPEDLEDWIYSDYSNSFIAVRTHITHIYYDEAVTQEAADEFMVEDGDITTVSGYGHTRNRITGTEVLIGYFNPGGLTLPDTWIAPVLENRTHYRYDIHGNVSSYLQEVIELAEYNQPFTRVDYAYDLISGNPNYIWYQKGKPDQYIHHYRYDSDNRLKEVFTSNDGQVWDRDVNYEYREDGYLARTELGEMKVQGMDYAYTLHGWIKTLNSGVLNPTNDMGKDGDLATTGTAEYDFYEDDVHDLHARDVLSYTVGYYNGDYTQISAGVSGYDDMPVAIAGDLASDIDELFNGNITSYISATTTETGTKLDPLATSYHYDQLHRFIESQVFTYTNITSTNSTLNAVRNNIDGTLGLADYEMSVSYDANGNIMTLTRMAYGATNEMDIFDYTYANPTQDNKLDNVFDASFVNDVMGYGDIEGYSQTSGNYTYYADGSLRSDASEGITNIIWYPNGLVKWIRKSGGDLYFEYDAMGNRVLKVHMIGGSGATSTWVTTHYAYDANGILLATYDLSAEEESPMVLSRIEANVYGGSRLGMEITPEIINVAADYLNDCNNDGLATGIIQLGAFTPTDGVVLDILLDISPIASITWNTANSIESHGEDLVEQINADAYGYYAEMIDMGAYVYIRLKETIAGSLSGKTLMVELNNSEAPSYIKREFSVGECAENRILGNKLFELSNYLGNVNEVISDRKIAVDTITTDNVTDYFEADVISYADYYPFGQDMPGRGGSMANYRYGYNGMEKDNEVSGNGNSYTTQFRQYDPRLGRWKSLDPLAGSFPDISPFAAFGNNPVYFVDPFGLAPSNGGEGKSVDGNSDPKKGDVVVVNGVEIKLKCNTVNIETTKDTDGLVVNASSVKVSNDQPWNIEINGVTYNMMELTKEGGQFSFLSDNGEEHLVMIPKVDPSEYIIEGNENEVDEEYWKAFSLGFVNAFTSDVMMAVRQSPWDMGISSDYEDAFYLGEIYGDAAGIISGCLITGGGVGTVMGGFGVATAGNAVLPGAAIIIGGAAIVEGAGIATYGGIVTVRSFHAMSASLENYENAKNNKSSTKKNTKTKGDTEGQKASQQYEGIKRQQEFNRKQGGGKQNKIFSTKKSEQRDAYNRNRLRNRDDANEEFGN